LDADTLWKNPRKAYVLLNVEPELDCANAPLALNALEQADCVVSLMMYKNPVLMQYAHVILPITPFTETAGTFVNVTGEWQRFNGIATPVGEARPAWKVLRVLGNLFHCEGFDYQTAHEIHDELKTLIEQTAIPSVSAVHALSDRTKTSDKLSRIGEIPLYAGDSLQRRAKALQATQTIIQENLVAVRLHSETARELKVNEADIVTAIQGNNRVRLPVLIDERVPVNAVYIAGGILATHHLSELYGPIEIHKA